MPRTKPYKPAYLLLGVLIGVVGGALISRTSTLLPPPNSHAPPGSLRLVVVVLMFGLIHLVVGIQRYRSVRESAQQAVSGRPKLRRQTGSAGAALLRSQLVLAAITVFTAGSHWNAESVGLDSEWSIASSFAVGFVAYVAFALLLTWLLKASGRLPVVEDNNLRVMAMLWPRGRGQKASALVAICLLNPFIEEFMYRGVLVHQLAYATDALPLALALGLVMNLGNHAYQGPLAMTSHLPIYLITTALLFSPAGLWGAFGFHFAGDLAPVKLLPQSIRRYVARHRRSAVGSGQ
jgi:membrane protease YdiL (CAAX protease family)